MNLRTKIADEPEGFIIECRRGKAYLEKGAPLPRRFKVSCPERNKIQYCLRLLHLHSQAEAEKLHKSFPREVASTLDIIETGDRLDGLGIPRFWLVKEEFPAEADAAAWRSDTSPRLDRALRNRIQVEGGIYRRYSQLPGANVVIKSADGSVIADKPVIRMKSTHGITITNAPVGETFHWQRREDLTFEGALEFHPGEKGLLAVNEIPLEEYLASVNSSEMSAQSPLEFLKAQTIAARSAVLATKGCHHYGEPFDLCNGDHCQCYYGITRVEARSQEAVSATDSVILTHRGIVADARYAKTCGGMRERFDAVWESFNPEYLPAAWDGEKPLLLNRDWDRCIASRPDCWCNPETHPYPEYFDHAKPWFRWKISQDNNQLAEIIVARTGVDVGAIKEIRALSRGDSGRINRLLIIGEKEVEIAGELNIRRALSDTHLPSSCFTAEIDDSGEMVVLRGAGWGHGVGMCQMGALNMALAGKNCEEILRFYYPNTKLTEYLY